jgi:hypothetical protein
MNAFSVGRTRVAHSVAVRRQRPALRLAFEHLETRLLLAPIANAGPDRDISRGEAVALNGSASAGDGSLVYTWHQISGPDVTGGDGTLVGAAPSFIAPPRVSTLQFDLIVTDASGDSTPDRVVVSVLEDHNNALFVSPAGSDTNPGTRAAPLFSLIGAMPKAAAGGDDLYVAGGVYSGSVTLVSGVSVYGGFNGANWVRDPLNFETKIAGGPTAVQGNNIQSIVLDGLTIESADATTSGGSSRALVISGAGNVEISGNIIRAGKGFKGVDGGNATPPASSTAATGNNGGPGSEDGSVVGMGGAQTAGPEFGGKGGNGGSEGSNTGQAGSPGSGGAAGGPGGAGGDPGRDGGMELQVPMAPLA